MILRKERPHPGAQLSFADADGMRITATLTDTPPGVVPGQVPGLELRHRQHARVEDRIREAKATGLRNLPCRAFNENAAWLEVVLTAVDLVCWTQADRLRRPARTRPLRDRHLPLPDPPRRRPAHPHQPTNLAPDRQDLALGSPDRRRLPPTPRRVHLTTGHPAPPTKDHGNRPPDATAGQPVTHRFIQHPPPPWPRPRP